MKLDTGASLVSHADRPLARLATPGPVYIKRQCAQGRWTLSLMKWNYARQTIITHVRYPNGGETTVATKHLVPNGHIEVVETLPAPERITEETGNMSLDTHVSFTLDAKPSSAPELEPKPQPELKPE